MSRVARHYYDGLNNDHDRKAFLEAIHAAKHSAKEEERNRGVCFICVYDSLIRL